MAEQRLALGNARFAETASGHAAYAKDRRVSTVRNCRAKWMKGYSFYRPYTYEARDVLFKTMGLKVNSKVAKTIPYQKYFVEQTKVFDAASAYFVWEHEWLKSPLILFPESAELTTKIIKGNFEGKLTNVHSEFTHFSIAVPQEVTFGGKHALGIFVTIVSHQEQVRQLNQFCIDFNVNRQFEIPFFEQKMFTINYRTSTKLATDNVINSVSQPLEQLLTYLEQNNDETQNEIIRFVLGFLIYISAFDDVIEDASYIKMPKKVTPNTKHRAYKVCHAGDRNGPCFHLRNLINGRFYKNDFKDLEPGTRWVPVRGRIKIIKGK
jgi:hypothetical protein